MCVEGFFSFDVYFERLEECRRVFDVVVIEFEMCEDFIVKDFVCLCVLLYIGEIGWFWVIVCGCDKYIVGVERSSFVREKEDMWMLILEKFGLFGRVLKLNFDNFDDKLCLIYLCVNDFMVLVLIDMLYSLKLFDEGLWIGVKGDAVTAEGFSFVVCDVLEKFVMYRMFVVEKVDLSLMDVSWVNLLFVSWSGVGI